MLTSDPALAPSAIAQVLGVKESGGQSLVEDLKTSLREKRLLLVLDNFEHMVAAAPLVSELLAAAPHIKVLVTSQSLLHLYGEYQFPVPPLEHPDPPIISQHSTCSRNMLLYNSSSSALAPSSLTSP